MPAVVGCALALTVFVGCGSGDRSGATILRDAGESAPAERWAFVDRPDAEQLLACVAGFQKVAVAVDRAGTGRMAIGNGDAAGPLAIWAADASYVRSSALGRDNTDWVRIDRDDEQTVRQVEAALGLSLSAWVLAAQPPPAPNDLVASALEFAADVELVPTPESEAATIRVTIDESRVADLAGTEAAGYPLLTFTVVDGTLTTVAAQAGAEPDSFGFRWEYDRAIPVVADVPSDWLDARTIPISKPPSAGQSCEIGP